MTFSQEPFQVNISNDNDPIDVEDLAYFSQRTKNGAFQEFMRLFAQRAKDHGMTKTRLAKRISKDKAQISRLFAGPKNWTLDTLSELSLGLGYETRIVFSDLTDDPRHNYCHPLLKESPHQRLHYEVEDGIASLSTQIRTSSVKTVSITTHG